MTNKGIQEVEGVGLVMLGNAALLLSPVNEQIQTGTKT